MISPRSPALLSLLLLHMLQDQPLSLVQQLWCRNKKLQEQPFPLAQHSLVQLVQQFQEERELLLLLLLLLLMLLLLPMLFLLFLLLQLLLTLLLLLLLWLLLLRRLLLTSRHHQFFKAAPRKIRINRAGQQGTRGKNNHLRNTTWRNQGIAKRTIIFSDHCSCLLRAHQ